MVRDVAILALRMAIDHSLDLLAVMSLIPFRVGADTDGVGCKRDSSTQSEFISDRSESCDHCHPKASQDQHSGIRSGRSFDASISPHQ